jgi:hypothetical protein
MSQPDLSRREFLAATGASALAIGSPLWSALGADGAGSQRERWYEHAYRRAVIDMHIPDWDPKFLSEFDPQQYAEMLVKSKAQSVVCYCQSHVGLFNFPTEVGTAHAAFAERNMLGEMIDACHERNIAVQLYTSLIFDRTAADQHPEWRMITWDGNIQGEGGRHGVLCINSPYREYVRSFVTEICQKFEFEGIRFDMTFWPWLCFCEHCQRRFDEEVGGEIPQTIDWGDPRWVAFQRCRERWLVEFAAIATSTVREHRPVATVEHQSSTFPLNWMFGVTAPLAAQNDFLQGDFYGDSLQGSFVRKLLEDLTPNRPFGYETSFSVSLQDHTARKPSALLAAKAAAAIADQAAFVFIDAIDPIGTVNPNPHERMGQVFEQFMPFYTELAELAGERVADIGIYYSLESKFDPATSGGHVSSPNTSDSHTSSSMQVARTLLRHHLPWRVVTRGSLGDVIDAGKVKLLILSNVHMLDADEAAMLRRFVENGGSLYVSGGSTLLDPTGKGQMDFPLADVMGVSMKQTNWQPFNHYIAPTDKGLPYFVDFNAAYPAFHQGYGIRVAPHADATVLAKTTLPWPTADGTRFASIHSNPPWVTTDEAEIVEHTFGRGRCIYSASVIESSEIMEGTLISLLKSLAGPPTCTVDAPPFVEMTLFYRQNRGRFLLSLVNFPSELPGVPIHDIRVTLRIPPGVFAVSQLPDRVELDFVSDDEGTINFTIPRLETFAMIEVCWAV